MKLLTIFFFSFCCTASLLSQPSTAIALESDWLRRGDSLLLNTPDSALYWANRVLQSKAARSDCNLKGIALNLKSRALYFKEDYKIAFDIIKEGLKVNKLCKNDAALATSLNIYAILLSEELENDTAAEVLSSFEAAAQYAQRSHDTLQAGKILTNLGITWGVKVKAYEKALYYHRQCDTLLKNTHFNLQRSVNRIWLGNRLLDLYYDSNDPAVQKNRLDEAASIFSLALKDLDRLDGPFIMKAKGDAKNGLGAAKMYADEIDSSEIYYRESIQIFSALKDTALILNPLNNLVILTESKGLFLAAMDSLERVHQLALAYKGNDPDAKDLITHQLTGSTYDDRKALLKGNEQARILLRNQYLFASGFVLCLLLVIGYFLYRDQRKRARHQLEQLEAARKQKELEHQILLAQKDFENEIQDREIKFAQEKTEVENTERLRIARELHDGVGGMLASTKWSLETTLESAPPDSPMAQRLMEHIRQQEESYQALRKVSHTLRDTVSIWWHDLQRFCARLGNSHTTIHFHTRNLDKAVEGKLGEEARLMTQELIVNAMKSAKPTEINVEISKVGPLLSIIVQDNGSGFDPNKVTEGIGLRNIRERVEQERGGTLSIDSVIGQGTTIFIDLPLQDGNALDSNPLKFDNDESF